MDVDDVGRPGVGTLDGAHVEEDGFGGLAGLLGGAGFVDKVADERPDRVGGRGARVVLFKVKGAGAIGGAGGEGVAEGGGAG